MHRSTVILRRPYVLLLFLVLAFAAVASWSNSPTTRAQAYCPAPLAHILFDTWNLEHNLSGTWNRFDCTTVRPDSRALYADRYYIYTNNAATFTLRMTSAQQTSQLFLSDSSDEIIASGSASGDGETARIEYALQPGVYRLTATKSTLGFGSYRLSISSVRFVASADYPGFSGAISAPDAQADGETCGPPADETTEDSESDDGMGQSLVMHLYGFDSPERASACAEFDFHNYGDTTVDSAGHVGWDVRTTNSEDANVEFYSLTSGEVVAVESADPESEDGDTHAVAVFDGERTTVYRHAKAVYVRPGDLVGVGQVLGIQGCSGECDVAHVQIEVHDEGVSEDPVPYLHAYLVEHGVIAAQ